MSTSAITVDAARRLVVDRCRPLEAEPVAVGEALGRVLAQGLQARADVPPFANSAMDGFAVAAPTKRRLPIAGESRAGLPYPDPMPAGTAIRISTGAPLPARANAVIPLELVTESDGTIELSLDPEPGANVRAAGEDMRAGDAVLTAGTRMGPAELAVAVGAGAGSLSCARIPRIVLIATGDELRAPGEPLGPGQIHNSNAVALAALARRAGAAVAAPLNAGDDAGATRAALAAALSDADVVVATGGVSVGAHDHVKAAMRELGVKEIFWRVALRPGRPTWFGARGDTLAFGLPGNPVSAMVTFALFVEPALAAMQGAAPEPRTVSARLAGTVHRHRDRTEAVRVTLSQHGIETVATPTGPQGSHQTRSMLRADGFALIEPGEGGAEAGHTVTVILSR